MGGGSRRSLTGSFGSRSPAADAFNIEGLFDAASARHARHDAVKVGGYQRLTQMAESLQERPSGRFPRVRRQVTLLAENARPRRAAHEGRQPQPPRKSRQGAAFDCFIAPCTYGCPHQDIPEYIELVGKGAYAEALALIVRKPAASVTGHLPARCTDKVHARLTEACAHPATRSLPPRSTALRVSATVKPGGRPETRRVIGGGPAGMAAGFFLARQGATVTMFDSAKSSAASCGT